MQKDAFSCGRVAIAIILGLTPWPHPASARPCLLPNPNTLFTQTAMQLPGITEPPIVAGQPSTGGLALSQRAIELHQEPHPAAAAFADKNYPEALRLAEIWVRGDPTNLEARRYLGWSLFELHNYRESKHVAIEALTLSPMDEDVHWLLVRARFELDEFEDCITECEVLYKRNDLQKYHSLLARAHMNAGHLVEAESAARRALQLDPGDLRPYLTLAYMAYEKNETRNARKFLEQFLADIRIPRRLYMAAKVALKAQDVPYVESLFPLTSQWGRNNKWTLLALTQAAFQRSSFTDAKTKVLLALTDDTGAPVEGYVLLGRIQRQIGQPTEAINSFSQALQMEPWNVNALIQRALAYSSLTWHALAFEDALAAIRAIPKRASTWSYLKSLLAIPWRQHDTPPKITEQDAENDILEGLSMVVQKTPENVYRRHYAYLLAIKGRLLEATALIEQILRETPKDVYSMRCAYWIYAQAGFPGTGFPILHAASLTQWACDPIFILAGLVDAAIHSGETSDLREAMQLIRNRRSSFVHASDIRLTHILEGRLELALQHPYAAYDQALAAYQANPDQGLARHLLALVHLRWGNASIALNLTSELIAGKALPYQDLSHVYATRADALLMLGRLLDALHNILKVLDTCHIPKPEFLITLINILVEMGDDMMARQAATVAATRFPHFSHLFQAA